MKRWIFLVLPLLLLGALVAFFLGGGAPPILSAGLPPVEEVAFERVELAPGRLTLHLLNDGPDPVTIAQVLVNDAYWSFTIEPGATLRRLGRAVLTVPYPWVEGEPQRVRLVTRNGVTFDAEVPVAVATPRPDAGYLGSLALVGFYIGVVPVFLGLLWLPFLRSLKSGWFAFFLALTLGLLLFLGVDSLAEAIETAADTPGSLMGIGVLTIGFALAFLLISAFSRRERKTGPAESPSGARALHGAPVPPGGAAEAARWDMALAVAIGIGVHNLGEGLAIGGAYAAGNVALGALLVVGFMIHNVTEGVAVVAPVSRSPIRLPRLAALGLLAGAPAIPGAWIGGFAYSAIWAVFFLAVGAGAIFQVFVEILGQMLRGGRAGALLTVRNAFGFLLGLLVMYGTGLLAVA